MKTLVFRDLDDFYPNRIITLNQGCQHRLWLVKANQMLTNLLTEAMGEDIWLKNLGMLKLIEAQYKTPATSNFKLLWKS